MSGSKSTVLETMKACPDQRTWEAAESRKPR